VLLYWLLTPKFPCGKSSQQKKWAASLGWGEMNVCNNGTNSKNQAPDRKTRQVKVSVYPDLAHEFSKACSKMGISMAGAISSFMMEFTGAAAGKKTLPNYSTKRQRRAAIKKMVKELEQIMDAEAAYMENIPENLAGSVFYDNAEQFISSAEDAIEILSSI
jgi:hypothetical protein